MNNAIKIKKVNLKTLKIEETTQPIKLKNPYDTELINDIKNEMNIHEWFDEIDTKMYEKVEKSTNPRSDDLMVQLKLCYMDRYYGNNTDQLAYYKTLKKRIETFKKEVYDGLTKEQKEFIKLLDKFSMKSINKAIKENMNDLKEILAQKNKK